MTALAAPARRSPSNLLPWGIGLAWFSGVVALAARGFFAIPTGPMPLLPVAAAALLPLLFLLAHRTLPGVRAWVAGLDLGLVVGAQAFRVIGIVFLAYWLSGQAPAVFAIPAGLGDIAVGAIGLGAALALARDAPGWQDRARRLVLWGLADFALAFTLALLAMEGMPLQLEGAPLPDLLPVLPIVLVPAFGVPAFAILHAIAWIRLRDA